MGRGIVNMKKTFVMSRLCLLFLILACISGSALAIINQNPSITDQSNRINTFTDVLNRIDTVTHAVSQEELRDINNSEAMITNIGNIIPHDVDIRVLNALRIAFTGRIIFYTESLTQNIPNVLRATLSLDAVTRNFDARVQQNSQSTNN
jgi:hypothetical protein